MNNNTFLYRVGLNPENFINQDIDPITIDGGLLYLVEERKDIIQLTKTLKNIFNSIIEAGIKIEDLKFKEVGIIIMAASLYSEYEAIEKAQEKLKDISKLDNKNFGRRIVNKRTIGIIETFVKEWSLW